MTNLNPFVESWMLLVVIVLGLALYRKLVSMREDPFVHVSQGEARLIPAQVETNKRLARIDLWGETLTVCALVAGLALACVYLYGQIYNR